MPASGPDARPSAGGPESREGTAGAAAGASPPGPSDAPAGAPPASAALATLVRLLRRIRAVRDPAELNFALVNETQALVGFRQAALIDDGGRVQALSGVAAPETNAPYVDWLRRLVRRADVAAATPVAPLALNLAARAAPEPPDQTLADATPARSRSANPARAAASPVKSTLADPDPDLDGWQEWLPPHLLITPLPQRMGTLLLARSEPFTAPERALLLEWTDAWADAAARATYRHQRRPARQLLRLLRHRGGWLLIALAALGAVPVPLTVLAPAELVPADPAIIRAPLDGVVERILVRPNQRVAEGEPLFEFDRQSLESRLEVAERALATARAEYQQAAQAALFDPQAKAQLEILQAAADEKTVEVEFLTALNARGRVLSPRAGIALIEDPNQWPGRPVVTGERVMVVADEYAVRLEAWLSPADAIPLESGSSITFYPAANPLSTLTGTLDYMAYEAELRPEGQYAYRVRGSLMDDGAAKVAGAYKNGIADVNSSEGAPAVGAPPGPGRPEVRVGMRGTAKLHGARVPLIYWAVRRPWATLRGWMGW